MVLDVLALSMDIMSICLDILLSKMSTRFLSQIPTAACVSEMCLPLSVYKKFGSYKHREPSPLNSTK